MSTRTNPTRPQTPPIFQLLLHGLSPLECLSLILYYSPSMTRQEIDAALSLCAGA